MTPIIHAIRRGLYSPLEAVKYLPLGPVRYVALVCFLAKHIVAIGAPLRRALLKGFDAKST